MKKSALLISVILLAAAGCKSAETRQVEDTRMARVVFEPARTTVELEAEINSLIQKLLYRREVVYKDDLDGMQSNTINRLVEIGQPAVPALAENYYAALSRRDMMHYRYLCIAIFQRMQEPMTQDFLVNVLSRGDRKERRLAAEALWRFGDSTCVGALINQLEDDSLDVVVAVSAALRAITGFNFGIYRSSSETQRAESVQRWRQWWSVTGSSFPRTRADSF